MHLETALCGHVPTDTAGGVPLTDNVAYSADDGLPVGLLVLLDEVSRSGFRE
jgi:hypothetical protein|tara:strand:+ start:682 stop:837 length:156 start_codon:yes stop_codon:yes gene_type:complete